MKTKKQLEEIITENVKTANRLLKESRENENKPRILIRDEITDSEHYEIDEIKEGDVSDKPASKVTSKKKKRKARWVGVGSGIVRKNKSKKKRPLGSIFYTLADLDK